MNTKDSGAASVTSETVPSSLSVPASVAEQQRRDNWYDAGFQDGYDNGVFEAKKDLARLRTQRDELAAAARGLLDCLDQTGSVGGHALNLSDALAQLENR